jgi:hypothetical protein
MTGPVAQVRGAAGLLRTTAGCKSGAMPVPPIERLRVICLALPEAVEKETWGDPTFRVRDRIFAMEKRGDGRISVWCKAPPGSQMALVGADPHRFFVPPYVGHKGWAEAARRDDRMTALVANCGRDNSTGGRRGPRRKHREVTDDVDI